jgi:tripartite-type tricarboxylate transporter receptor subunit TctC
MADPLHRKPIATLGLAALLSAGAGANAQDFPTKPVRIIASETGSSGDFVARVTAQGLTSALGQQVIVENRGGGVLAGDLVARSPADGYTLLLYGNTLWLLPLMRKQVPYDPQRDFVPISLAARGVNILVVHPSLPVKSVKELIALARARPGQLNFSTAALGTMNHLAAELFKFTAKLNVVRVTYRGSPSAMNAVMTGETQFMFSPAAPANPLIRSGRVLPLAVSTRTRSPSYPNLPTMEEAGMPGFEAVSYHGIFAPAKTPEPVLARLNQEIVRVLQRSDTRERMEKIGVEAAPGTQGEMANLIRDEVARMGKVIREAGIEER